MSLVSRYLDSVLIERLASLELSARRIVVGSTIGPHRSPVKGASIEFRQHRFYVPGDEPKRLDWRVLARTDRPYVKEYDEENNLRCLVLLDASASMAYARKHGSKFDYAARLTASLSFLMLNQTESVGFAVVRNRLDHFIAPRVGKGHLASIIAALERSGPAGESNLATALHDAGNRLERRALVVLISDLFNPIASFREGIAHLKHDRHEVICLRVLDRDELDFPFRRVARFQNLEQNDAQLIEPALARSAYQKNFLRHQRQLEDQCQSLQVELQTFLTDEPLGDALHRFLRKRYGAVD
jgi:uncharacterized protein (DUF58 family)